jgi:hypothetical protein
MRRRNTCKIRITSCIGIGDSYRNAECRIASFWARFSVEKLAAVCK